MQLSALFPVVALLATGAQAAIGRSNHHNGMVGRTEAHKAARELYQAHERAQAQIAANVERREALAARSPQSIAKEKRFVRRAGAQCAVQNAATSANSTTSTTSASSTSTSLATTSSSTTSSTQSTSSSTQAASSSAAPASAASSAQASTVATHLTINTSGGGMNGGKPGISGGDGLQQAAGHAHWYYDWNAISYTSPPSGMVYIPMLWGLGQTGPQDAQRFADFKSLTPGSSPYVMGIYEPDCFAPMSSDVSPQDAAAAWLQYFLPWRQAGSQLISPGLCKQKDEDWFAPFLQAIGQENIWDITALHINKPDMAGVKADLDHYAQYGKPMMVAEFACVDDQNGFTPCSDQGQIDAFINDCVQLFQSDSRVVGYALSGGAGLGGSVPFSLNGAVTQAGNTFLADIASI